MGLGELLLGWVPSYKISHGISSATVKIAVLSSIHFQADCLRSYRYQNAVIFGLTMATRINLNLACLKL